MQAPKEGSRKRTVFDVMQKSGVAAATKKGAALGLAEGTVKSWLAFWAKGDTAQPASSSSPKASAGLPAPITPDFRYSSEAKARRAADAQAKNNNMDPSVFSVIPNASGKFAFVPRHDDPSIQPGKFKKGQRVFARWNPTNIGVILAVGDEQCMVKFSNPAMTRGEPNKYLEHVK